METSAEIKEKKKVREFKSYYVVWKRKHRKIFLGQCDKFKSYYVVWKLSSISIIFFPDIGLNRTM